MSAQQKNKTWRVREQTFFADLIDFSCNILFLLVTMMSVKNHGKLIPLSGHRLRKNIYIFCEKYYIA